MAQTHSLDLGTGSENKYASVAHSAVFNFGTGAFTIEFWAKLADTTLDATENVVRHYNSGGWVVQFKSASRVIQFFATTTGPATSVANAIPNDTGWHHYAVTRNGATAKIYVDGKDVTSSGTVGSGSVDVTTDFYIGSNGSSEDFDGLIKDVRLFNTERTQAQIISDAHSEMVAGAVGEWNLNNAYTDSSGNGNTLTASGSPVFSTDIPWEGAAGISGSTYLETNLNAYWTLDEGAGTTKQDSTANNNDLSDTGTVGSATGIKSNGADFESASTHYLSVADTAVLRVVNGWSVSFWFKPESSVDGYLFNERSGESGWGVTQTSGNKIRVEAGSGAFGGQDGGISMSNGTWYHVVVVFNGATTRLYINGILDGILSSVPDITNPNTTVYLGKKATASTTYADGVLDEVAIYARALHYGDVLDLYNAGVGITFVGSTAYTKELTETVTLTDTVLKKAGKVLSETITHTDTLTKLRTAFATLTETVTFTDTIIRQAQKVLSETITLTDSIIKDIGRALTETITFTDTLLKSAAKTFTETVTMTDTLLRSAAKTLTETITHTDTFDSAYIYFRTLTETITHTDTVTTLRTAFQELTETITLTDTLERQATKVLSEVVTFTDTVVRSATKVLSETVTLTDSIVKDISRTLSETITLTDSLLREAGKVFSETVTLSDTFLRMLGKNLEETITFTDTLTRHIARTLTETVTLTDSLIKSTSRVLSETVTLTDTLLRQSGKLFSETMTFTDTLTTRLLTPMKKGIAVLTTRTSQRIAQLTTKLRRIMLD